MDDKVKPLGPTASRKKKELASHRLRRFLTKLVTPQMWSLKARFLYVSGVLLILGNISLIFFLSRGLEKHLDLFTTTNLSLARTWIDSELDRQRQSLVALAVSAAAVPQVKQALAERDEKALREFIVPYVNRLRLHTGQGSLNMIFQSPPGTPFFQTVRVLAQEDVPIDGALVNKVNRGLSPLLDVTTTRFDVEIVALAPVESEGGKHVGNLAAMVSVSDIIKTLDPPSDYSLSLLAPENPNFLTAEKDQASDAKSWRVLRQIGTAGPSLYGSILPETALNVRSGDVHTTFLSLDDFQGRPMGGVLISHNASLLRDAKWQSIYEFVWFFLLGALFLWIMLNLNVIRVDQFLARLKRIILASHSNYFSERFESDHVHCLDLLHCNNEECPVHQDPSLVCYLETGSEAISPRWRNSCIYLNAYDTCRKCPVYEMRLGDELNEMRNVVNTMMRLWADFLNRIGHLLAYVLRSPEQGGQSPSLDDISDRLEQMAKLTFFSHDLQGVLDKDEVYQQLTHMFHDRFGLEDFTLFAVNPEERKMVIVRESGAKGPACRGQVIGDSDICRSCRVAEDVLSFYNPVLCPFFTHDAESDFRCCLPVVMGSKVQAVLSFAKPRREWEAERKELPVLRKYLDGAAPVLSSLGLLAMTKDQALHDPLTRAHNRRFLDEFIVKYEPLCQREGRRTGFLMADLDYFKQVNDEHGHEAGDAVLRQVVQIILNSIRRSDLLVRYGGEEFLVLLQNMDEGAAEAVAEKIRSNVERHPFSLPNGTILHKAISVGVADHPNDADLMYKAIKFADVALYEAKRTGRNRIVRFKPEMWTDSFY